MFNVIMKYPIIFEKLLPTFDSYSRTLTLLKMTLVSFKKRRETGKLDSTFKSASIEQFFGEWKNHYTVAALSTGLWGGLEENSSICAKLSCFNSLVQSALNARSDVDENANSSFVADTRKLLAKSSHGYQIMDWSRHTVTKYLSEEKTHGTINSKRIFKRLGCINDNSMKWSLSSKKLNTKNEQLLDFLSRNWQN